MKLTQKTPPFPSSGRSGPGARPVGHHRIAGLLLFLALFTLPAACRAKQEPGAAAPDGKVAAGAQAGDIAVVSWNLQTFGHVAGERAEACRQAYSAVVSTAVYVMGVQEIAHENGMKTFLSLLPDGGKGWGVSFQDTPDSQDNAILYRTCCATVTAQGFLFTDPQTGLPDTEKAVHPIRWAHIDASGFDFTMLSLHLTFHGGDAASSKQELVYLLDWLKTYLADPKNDPDVIIAGDFNLPTDSGKGLSKRKSSKKWISVDSVIAEYPEFASGPHKLTVLVDEPTSRPSKKPQNNYDHFIVTPGMLAHIKAAGRMPLQAVDSADAGIHARVSDHYPVEALLSR